MMKIHSIRSIFLPLFILFSVFFIVLFAYRSLLLNMGTHLLDWNDYPLVAWIHRQNINHILQGNIKQFFETNAFYPHKKTLLFTEFMFPTSIFGAVFRMFASNMILVMNLLFFTTWLLNIVASYALWKNRFSGAVLWFAVLITACSPFLFLNAAHFQILTVWPMLFALSHLVFRRDFSRKHAIWLGVWMGIQFWSSVYLGTFLCFAVGIWWAIRFFVLRKQHQVWRTYVFRILLTLGISSFLAGPLLFQYWSVQRENGVQRESWEYVRYATDIADYVFTDQYGSFASSFPIMKQWNQFHKSGGTVGFPGFVVGILSIAGLFVFVKGRKYRVIGISLDASTLYFIFLLVCGFVFSLGTRLNVNGTYLVIPLPYYAVQKLVPFFEMIRATGRWALLFYFALAYFAAVGLEKFVKRIKHSWLIAGILGMIYVMEIVPINKTTEARNYYPSVYTPIAQQCGQKQKDILLEYPIMFDKKDRTPGDVVQYWSQQMYASLFHRCLMVNGYSGFFPASLNELRFHLENAILNNDKAVFFRLLDEQQISLVKLNISAMEPKSSERVVRWLREKKRNILYEDKDYFVIVYDIRKAQVEEPRL